MLRMVVLALVVYKGEKSFSNSGNRIMNGMNRTGITNGITPVVTCSKPKPYLIHLVDLMGHHGISTWAIRT